jgi:hypothetical protein
MLIKNYLTEFGPKTQNSRPSPAHVEIAKLGKGLGRGTHHPPGPVPAHKSWQPSILIERLAALLSETKLVPGRASVKP